MLAEGEGGKKHRKRVKLYLQFHGICFWCGRDTALTDHQFSYQATIDHIRDRTDKQRRRSAVHNEMRQVLACKQCNELRQKCVLASDRRFLTDHRFQLWLS